jgi:hypothetical protein
MFDQKKIETAKRAGEAYQELYGVPSNEEMASDEEWTSVIPVVV